VRNRNLQNVEVHEAGQQIHNEGFGGII